MFVVDCQKVRVLHAVVARTQTILLLFRKNCCFLNAKRVSYVKELKKKKLQYIFYDFVIFFVNITTASVVK